MPRSTNSCVPGADALSRESVGLLAAVMSGHTSLINEVLRQTGAPALAAAQVLPVWQTAPRTARTQIATYLEQQNELDPPQDGRFSVLLGPKST
eukprot:scaffold23310_cov16-Tisochrysis_lutea.AAC.2